MKSLENEKGYIENSKGIKSSVIPYSYIYSAKTYNQLDKKQDEHILHRDTAKIKTSISNKKHSPLENEWSNFNHKDWYCQGLAKSVFSYDVRAGLEKYFGSNVTNMIYQCIGSEMALRCNTQENHQEIKTHLNDSLLQFNSNENITVSKQDNIFSFQIDNKSFTITIDNEISIKTDNTTFYSNIVPDNNEIQSDKDNILLTDISSMKHNNWVYIQNTKRTYSQYDNARLQKVLDKSQSNYVYEYIGTQNILNESKKLLESGNLDNHTYDIVEKNISYLENHLYKLSQQVANYDELELKMDNSNQISSIATKSHYIKFDNRENGLSVRRKFGNKIDTLEYKPLISDIVQDTVQTVSAMNTTQESDDISNTTVNIIVSTKDIPSNVVEVNDKISEFSNSLEEHIKEDYYTFKGSKDIGEGIRNVIKDNVKTGVDKGMSSVKDLPKKIATSVGKKALNTKPNLSTSTDTGIDGIKTGVSGVRTVIDTKRTIDNTVTASKKFFKSVKSTPKAVARDIQKIKKIFFSVKQSSVGIIVVGVACFLLIIPSLVGGVVSGISSSVSSLFGWLYDEDDKSKATLEVLYDDWEYISKLLDEVQSTYDTTLNNPESINSNWKKSFERSDSQKHLYGYQDTILGEKFNYKEISLNVLSALAIDRYNQLVGSGSTTGTVTQSSSLVTNSNGQISLEFTEDEIEDKLKLFYETEYKETIFYCNNSVLAINVAYDECKSYDYFDNVFNTTNEKSFLYGSNYITSDNAIYMHIDGENDWKNIYFTPKYYEIFATQDDFLLHEINGNGYLYENGTHMYVIGEASFTDGSCIYCVRFSSVEDGVYPSYDNIYFLYSSDSMSYNFGGDIQVLDVNCSGHKKISCYIATKIKDKITPKDLGFTNEEYELFLLVKEELRKLIDEDNPNNTTTTVVATS